MDERLKQLLLYVTGFDEQDLKCISGCVKPQVYKKNAMLLARGEVCNAFYFVVKGCLRTYFISEGGHEKTRYLMLAPSMGTALTSFISQQPTFEFLDAVEDTEAFAIHHGDFHRLVLELPRWKDFYLEVLKMAYAFQNRRLESLVTLPARQRYEELMQENPRIIQQLSNKIVASYLDMSQETLSRLKSK